ncbi:MAG: valine--tRNA ligase, partial [Thermoprotei archaeon]
SYGNYIEVREVVEKYCADALRQWAASGATGYDIRFRWEDVDYAWRFLIKLWNASKFALSNLADYEGSHPKRLRVLDAWLLSKLADTIEATTSFMEQMRFNEALESIRDFTWHVFCDHYIEAVKYRLYGQADDDSRRASQYTLSKALFVILRLLAPFCPFITEEIYHAYFKQRVGVESIHLLEWPRPDECERSPAAEKAGSIIISTIAAIRRTKIRSRLSPGCPLELLQLDPGPYADALAEGLDDVKGTCRAREVAVESLQSDYYVVDEYPDIHFKFRAVKR